MARRNKIFLIGNGFDISHGLKTGYKDFFICYLKNCIRSYEENNKYSDDCISLYANRYLIPGKGLINHFEEVIESDQIQKLLPAKKTTQISTNLSRRITPKPLPLTIEPKNNFIKELILECLNSDWSGIEDLIYRNICAAHFRLEDKKKEIAMNKKSSKTYQEELINIKSINSSVNCLKINLLNYLNCQNNPSVLKEDLFDERVNWGDKFLESINSGENLVREILFLNFNYTTYYNELVKKVKTIRADAGTVFSHLNIHGSLDDSPENVVFGIGDEQNEYYIQIETHYDNEWLETMKTFHYLRSDYYQNLIGFLEKGDFEVYVYGHSCSVTDRTLLNMIFEHDSCKEISLFHYNGINSYLKTVYNIARNFKDKVKLRKVLQPFNPLLKM